MHKLSFAWKGLNAGPLVAGISGDATQPEFDAGLQQERIHLRQSRSSMPRLGARFVALILTHNDTHRSRN